MKNIFVILCLILPIKFFGQITDPELDKFVGTWKWVSGNDELTIVLQKQNFVNPNNGELIEVLAGWHSYIKNGTLQQSSMQYLGSDVNIDRFSSPADLKTTLRGFSRTSTHIHFTTVWDLILHKSYQLEFKLLPNSTTVATWELADQSGIYSGPAGTLDQFSFPKQITLTKQ